MHVIMASCIRCGWLGQAWERKARDDAMENFYCPRCSGGTKSWIVDQEREQRDLERQQGERSKASQRSLDAFQQSRVAHTRWHEAERELKRCQGRMSLVEADHSPDTLPYQKAKRNLLAAEQEAAAAALAKAEGKAKVRALGK